MGFLKELFEKKLRSSSTMKGGLGEGIDVEGRSHSEFFPQSLRQAQPGKVFDSGCHSRGLEELEDLSAASLSSMVRAEVTSHSFSVGQLKKMRSDHDKRATPPEVCQAPAVTYNNISQFSQKVELYRGSVSTVYKASCVSTQSKVIIKAYHKSKMHPKHHHKLHREIAAMRSLNGPYVAQLYATFEDPNCIYIIMEYCEGGDLFKTMLMHGGLLDEQWVCIEIITPLLRILEKMHSLKLMHRDIKPENIFLTSLGKFKLGDFGLAIKHDEEVPFSRSGTLDYMAPEVLKNPSVPFQESKAIDLATLAARGVKPYTVGVDVWAVGVLAYELVCGRPPFEVEDEAKTAALIMYSDAIRFPANRSSQWADFVRQALIKDPDRRPSAAALLQHTWIQSNLQRTITDPNHRPSKDMLMLPLPLPTENRRTRDLRRSVSLKGKGPRADSFTLQDGSAAAADRLREIQTVLESIKRPAISDPGQHEQLSPSSPRTPHSPASNLSSPHHGAHHPPAHHAHTALQSSGLASPPGSHGGSSPGGLAHLKLKIGIPEMEDSLDSMLAAGPSTPAPKPGIKERMKFYFQRQAGGLEPRP